MWGEKNIYLRRIILEINVVVSTEKFNWENFYAPRIASEILIERSKVFERLFNNYAAKLRIAIAPSLLHRRNIV